MEGIESVSQVNPVSRITGEGRAAFVRARGPGIEQEEDRGRGGKGIGRGDSICVRKLYIHIYLTRFT